jgi:hypothetical protein
MIYRQDAKIAKKKLENCNGHKLVEPQSTRRTRRIREKISVPFALSVVKFLRPTYDQYKKA